MLKIETSVKGDWRRLSASRWLAGVEGVIEDLRTARFVQPAMLLRETAHLLAAAPQPLAAWLDPVADIEALEAMLAAQAEESFARLRNGLARCCRPDTGRSRNRALELISLAR